MIYQMTQLENKQKKWQDDIEGWKKACLTAKKKEAKIYRKNYKYKQIFKAYKSKNESLKEKGRRLLQDHRQFVSEVSGKNDELN